MKTEQLQGLAISKNGFVFDPANGYSYSVNDTGLFIIKLLQAGATEEEVIAKLEAEYDTSTDNASSDFVHFISMLKAMDLVEA